MNYKVDLSQVTPAKSSKLASSASSNVPSASSTLPRQDQLSVSQVQKARSSNDLGGGGDDGLNSVRILKIRLVGRDEYDRDFIEVDLPAHCLSFRRLVDVVCEEFSIDPNSIVKIRKLPNTRLRRDAEIQRLNDYQELEVETVEAEQVLNNAEAEEEEKKGGEKAAVSK